MRVLHLYKDYAPVVGGIENHLRLLAEGLVACGIDTQVLVTNTGPTTVRTRIGSVPVTKTARLLNVSSAPISLPFYPALYRLEAGVDIAHAHLPYPPGEIGQLVLGRSRRFVLTYHSDIVRQRVLGTLYGPLLHLVLRRAHLIAVASPSYVNSSPYLSRVPEKCRVIPYGIDLTRFASTPAVEAAAAELRARYGPRPLLLFVGRLRHYKGLHVLITAMRDVDGHLLVIGSGPMESEWRSQVTTLGLGERITFLGDCSDDEVLAALHAATVFVLPSTNRAEAFGIVQLEAMACGLPVVCTELGTGTSYVNVDGETGFVVPPDDPPALAATLTRILRDDTLRRRLGAAALARCPARVLTRDDAGADDCVLSRGAADRFWILDFGLLWPWRLRRL